MIYITKPTNQAYHVILIKQLLNTEQYDKLLKKNELIWSKTV
jgi:hypothetical protein